MTKQQHNNGDTNNDNNNMINNDIDIDNEKFMSWSTWPRQAAARRLEGDFMIQWLRF